MQLQDGILPVEAIDFDRIVEVWEAAVRHTHHFLSESDIQSLKPLVREYALPMEKLACMRETSGRLVGFVGVAEDKVEMLFVHPCWHRRGVGRRLLEHAMTEMGARLLDVNEPNEEAISFYLHMGFEVIGRSERDSLGQPFPLLHMRAGRPVKNKAT